MIITCPSCEKKFHIDADLIPDRGRLLKCGTCNETWFFNKINEISIKSKENISIKKDFDTQKKSSISSNFNNDTYNKNSNISKNKGSELIKYKSKSNFTISKLLSYIIVLVISFIGIIIVLDTFKNPLSVIFPNLELIIYNLFETLRDLVLFAKDLK